jgi:hypothetical protein
MGYGYTFQTHQTPEDVQMLGQQDTTKFSKLSIVPQDPGVKLAFQISKQEWIKRKKELSKELQPEDQFSTLPLVGHAS